MSSLQVQRLNRISRCRKKFDKAHFKGARYLWAEIIEEKEKQFMIEKIIRGIENENAYTIYTKKKPRIMREIEKTYKICRRVYQSLFIDITDIFIEYIQPLGLDKIQQMDHDIKSNGWLVKSLCRKSKMHLIFCVFFKCSIILWQACTNKLTFSCT